MLLAPKEADLFFKLLRAFMCFVNGRLGIVHDVKSPDQFSGLSPEDRFKVRTAFLSKISLLGEFVDANPFDFDDEELGIVATWRHLVAEKFFIVRYLKKYAVFLATEEPSTAYGVWALTQPFEDLVGPYLPIMTETVLLPFNDKIVYDGLLSGPGVSLSFGPGIRRMLHESYKAAKERLGIVTALPIVPRLALATKSSQGVKRVGRPRTTAKATEAVHDVVQVIIGLTDQFCREHLNEEYAVLCRKLTEKLARKRPSPLLSGKPTTWACGIVRTIGIVNFLDDRSQRPHLKLTAIDKAFGVGESTGQGKSMLIRKMLGIGRFDYHWTLPSRMDDNPLIWMLNVNGLPTDIRHCPREAQEVAFEKGLIPYIPADRP